LFTMRDIFNILYNVDTVDVVSLMWYNALLLFLGWKCYRYWCSICSRCVIQL